MISRDSLKLWFSKYNLERTGFTPVVKPVRIVIEHPAGVWRKLTRIVPYSSPDGGFGVMVPYHKANSGFLYKARIHDSMSKLVQVPRPVIVSQFVVSSKIKMSFHSDGAVQFSSMDGPIISGRDPVKGTFKGLGIISRPFTNPVWSGPTFCIQAWGLSQFATCIPDKDDIRFTIPEMANPYLRYAKKLAVMLEAYIMTRARPIASTPMFPDYRAVMKTWNRRLGVFGTREMRLIALHSEEALLAVHVLKFPNIFSTPSGFILGSPRDIESFGIYAVYPRTNSMRASQSLDYLPLGSTSASRNTSTIIEVESTIDAPEPPRFLIPDE